LLIIHYNLFVLIFHQLPIILRQENTAVIRSFCLAAFFYKNLLPCSMCLHNPAHNFPFNAEPLGPGSFLHRSALATSCDVHQTRTYPYKQSCYKDPRGIGRRGAETSPLASCPALSHPQLELEKESVVHYPHACPDSNSHVSVRGVTNKSK
jgi:hypothetical protein